MKRMYLASATVLMLGILAGAAVAQSKSDFAGTWVLDTKKTRDVPAGLKSYILNVRQDENQISFEAKVEGDLSQTVSQDQPRTSNLNTFGEVAGHNSSPGPATGVAGSAFADTGTVSSTSRVNVARGRAFSTVIRRMNCRLDGEERIRELSGLSPGRLRRKAIWKTPNKSIELHLLREFDTQGSVVTSSVRELWELADGGKELRVKRTVNLLAGWDEVTLVFSRQ